MWEIVLVTIIPLIIVAGLYFYFVHTSLAVWFNARLTGAKLNLFDIAFLRLQNVKSDDIKKIVDKIVIASKAGVYIDFSGIGVHLMAGGDADRLIQALIEAGSAGVPLTLDQASAIDLAGRDVLEAVRMTIKPQVVETPEVSAMAKDGVQVKARCSVTIRANIDNFLGGVGKETILARVGTGIVSAIGSSDNHQIVQATPSLIADHIMSIDRDDDHEADIHQDSAFQVESIDVSDIAIGKNLRAGLDAEQATADSKKAEAEHETVKAEYVAREEEMKARIYEMEAKRLEARIQVPKAIAEAIRTGRLSLKEYFEFENLNADTEMRKAFSLFGETNREEET